MNVSLKLQDLLWLNFIHYSVNNLCFLNEARNKNEYWLCVQKLDKIQILLYIYEYVCAKKYCMALKSQLI